MQVNVETIAALVDSQFNSKLIGGKVENACSLVTIVLHHTLLWLQSKDVKLVLKNDLPIVDYQVVVIDENKMTEHVYNQFKVIVDGKEVIYSTDLSLPQYNEKTADGLFVQLGTALYSRAKKSQVDLASVDEWFLPNPTATSTPTHNSLEYIKKLHTKVQSGENISTPIGPIPNAIMRSYYKFLASVAAHVHYELFNTFTTDFPKVRVHS